MPPEAAFAHRDTLAPARRRARRIRQLVLVSPTRRSACGLNHCFSSRSWPSMAGLIWWMLRDRNAG